jgi:hypothetical protein
MVWQLVNGKQQALYGSGMLKCRTFTLWASFAGVLLERTVVAHDPKMWLVLRLAFEMSRQGITPQQCKRCDVACFVSPAVL